LPAAIPAGEMPLGVVTPDTLWLSSTLLEYLNDEQLQGRVRRVGGPPPAEDGRGRALSRGKLAARPSPAWPEAAGLGTFVSRSLGRPPKTAQKLPAQAGNVYYADRSRHTRRRRYPTPPATRSSVRSERRSSARPADDERRRAQQPSSAAHWPPKARPCTGCEHDGSVVSQATMRLYTAIAMT